MFGHYIGKNAYLYHVIFTGKQGIAEQEIYPTCGNIPKVWSMRLFFNTIYGSMEEHSPFGDHPNDSSANLEERMGRFFTSYFDPKVLSKNSPAHQWDSIKVEISQYDTDHKHLATHVIGYYNTASNIFTHTWGK